MKLVKTVCNVTRIFIYIGTSNIGVKQDTDRLDGVYKKYHSPVNNGWIFHEVLMYYKQKGH